MLESEPQNSRVLARVRRSVHRSGLRQIEAAIAEVNAQLQNSDLPVLDQLVLAGRRRELRAARWVVNRLLGSADRPSLDRPSPASPPLPPQPHPSPASPPAPVPTPRLPLLPSLLDTVSAKLQSNLYNLTETPLEIDILKPEKRRELFYIVLRQFEEILQDLRLSQVRSDQLAEKQRTILRDLWAAATTEFFGKYYTLQLGDRQLELVGVLLQDADIVQTAILDKIPLVDKSLAHILFQAPLAIDDAAFGVGTLEAMSRLELLLENLMIQVSNAVVQPLLNRFGDVVPIKQTFYDRRLLSSREIERFRNNLSWRYRVEAYFSEPTAIFESRFNLFGLSPAGITKLSIYAPRNQELQQLAGIPYAVTLALEVRDAIAPRVRSTISLLGSSVVYVLTEVIGRGIGLIGRGIIKGIGNALQDPNLNRNSDRPR